MCGTSVQVAAGRGAARTTGHRRCHSFSRGSARPRRCSPLGAHRRRRCSRCSCGSAHPHRRSSGNTRTSRDAAAAAAAAAAALVARRIHAAAPLGARAHHGAPPLPPLPPLLLWLGSPTPPLSCEHTHIAGRRCGRRCSCGSAHPRRRSAASTRTSRDAAAAAAALVAHWACPDVNFRDGATKGVPTKSQVSTKLDIHHL